MITEPSVLQAAPNPPPVAAAAADDHVEKPYYHDQIFNAVKLGMLLPVQQLVDNEGVSVLSAVDESGHSLAHWVSLGGHTTLLRFLIENKAPVDQASRDELRQHPIHWAASKGHVAIIDLLLQTNVSIDTVDAKGCTPLIVACQHGHSTLAAYLMGKGARLQLLDEEGDTALHWAAFKGYPELVRLLVYSGFNPHQSDRFQQTPLHLAAIRGDLATVRDLIEKDNVSLEAEDKNGKTPLMLARGRNNRLVVDYLSRKSKQRSSIIPRVDLRDPSAFLMNVREYMTPVILFGPPGQSRAAFLFFMLNLLVWGYPAYLLKCVPASWTDLFWLHIVFVLLNFTMWLCLFKANSIEPGYLPKNTEEYENAIRQIAQWDEWKHSSTGRLARLCHTCRTVKPLRAKHCRICGRCVLAMDHHCPYIYNCVGFRNRGWFYAFVSNVLVCGIISLFFCYWMLRTLGRDWIIIMGGAQLTFFGLVALFIWSMSSLQLLANLTTNEVANKHRYDYLKDGRNRFYNPFSRSYLTNVMEYFHLVPPIADADVRLLNSGGVTAMV